ncbi:hypothetical protein LEN26_011658 [Aphanomyces euteiches]|nr:hypothetical protein LEN26_011658 [Aphanomyces euteiches]KAH9127983.1 hypothetical protein AeMF1_001788 [Aphanomyces euteiches]KAH9190610.1 hypothetical protein AeNC1_007407 [Aphanomyces euteiches]
MVLYKQVILTNLKSSPADTAKAFQELTSFILSKGGVVRDLSHRGLRTLGYPIDDRRWGGTFERHREAKLLVKTFETNPKTLKELEAKMKLSYPILRFTTFKVKKDPLRDVLKGATTAAPIEPFDWKAFKATLDENTKVFETNYVVEDDARLDESSVQPTEFDGMSKEDIDDMTEWLMRKTRPELAASVTNDEFNLAEDGEGFDDEEEDDDDAYDEEEYEQSERIEEDDDLPDWKRDSSYEPEWPSEKAKKD